jgi:Fe-S oxidoreductase
MDKETQEKFAMFYGMANAVGDLYEPVAMPDEERVAKAKAVFVEKLNADQAIALESCIHCGLCADACHYYIGTGDAKYTPIRKLDLLKRVYRREISPMRWLHRLYTADITADDLREWQPLVYDSCTECGRCSMMCPMGIHIADMVGLNREAMAQAGLIPAELQVMQQGQMEKGTIFEADVDVLEYKINEIGEQLGFKIPVDEKSASILVLTSGLDIMLFNDALKGTAKILNHMGVPWSFCTLAYEGANFGLLSGHEDTQRKAAEQVITTAASCGAKVIITPECGHAFPALRWYGAEMVGHELPFDVMSISEYLGKAVQEGRLKLRKSDKRKVVALHDPCKVGRMGGSFEEGRAVVEALGLELHETRSNHQYNFCCGGGAGVFLIKSATDLRQKAYEVKMSEIKETGAESLVVSCGSCRLNFETGKMKAHDTIEVDSLVALVADHLEGEPAAA